MMQSYREDQILFIMQLIQWRGHVRIIAELLSRGLKDNVSLWIHHRSHCGSNVNNRRTT
jgi:hypothetical protein